MKPAQNTLWYEYLAEREGCDVLLDEDGFLLFKFIDERVAFIRDIYVRPDARQKDLASKLFELFWYRAKNAGISRAVCQCDLNAPNSHISMKAILSRGFIPVLAQDQRITFELEI